MAQSGQRTRAPCVQYIGAPPRPGPEVRTRENVRGIDWKMTRQRLPGRADCIGRLVRVDKESDRPQKLGHNSVYIVRLRQAVVECQAARRLAAGVETDHNWDPRTTVRTGQLAPRRTAMPSTWRLINLLRRNIPPT
ncbi:hypothetical protein CSUB01_12381, partial [Colletotrichum sublineola]